MARSRARVFLHPVDYDAEFIVLRDFPVQGVVQVRHSTFDKGLVSKRKLRLLYESRLLTMKEGTYKTRPPPRAYRPHELVRMRVSTDKKTGKHSYGLFRNGVRVDGEPAPLPAPVEPMQEKPLADASPEPPVSKANRPRVRINKVPEDNERPLT